MSQVQLCTGKFQVQALVLIVTFLYTMQALKSLSLAQHPELPGAAELLFPQTRLPDDSALISLLFALILMISFGKACSCQVEALVQHVWSMESTSISSALEPAE